MKTPRSVIGTERVADAPTKMVLGRWDGRRCVRCVCIFESKVGPGLAAVGGAIDAVAESNAVAHGRFAGADPDYVGVIRLQRDGSDRDGVFTIEERLPCHAGIDGLEETASAGRDIDEVGIARDARDVGGASAHVGRTDASPLEAVECFGVDGGCGKNRNGKNYRK